MRPAAHRQESVKASMMVAIPTAGKTQRYQYTGYTADFSHHLAPTRGRRTDAHANKAQRRFRKDGLRDAKRQGDDDRREGIGEQMAHNNRQMPRASGAAPPHRTLAL